MKLKKLCTLLVTSTLVLSAYTPIVAQDNNDTLVNETTESRVIQHHISDLSISGARFGLPFNVSNATHEYGEVAYENLSNQQVMITVYKDAVVIGNSVTINAGDYGVLQFTVDEVGIYEISIEPSSGSGEIRGILSLLTSDMVREPVEYSTTQYHISNFSVSGARFGRQFNVSNATHEYGKVFYSNTTNQQARITVYKNGIIIGNAATVNAGDNGAVHFPIDEVGIYDIIVEPSSGSGEIRGILSLATSDIHML